MTVPSTILSTDCPRIIVVSRRSIRKDKVRVQLLFFFFVFVLCDHFVTTPCPVQQIAAPLTKSFVRPAQYINFVGEYHLDLLVKYKALPIIVPRVADVLPLLDSLRPIHGLLLTEGEDIALHHLSTEPTMEELASSASHPSDITPDHEKDTIEFQLVRRCLRQRIPLLAICRGSQLVNVACGGTLHVDVDAVLKSDIKHIDYDNYDAHRHPLHLVPDSPVHAWFDRQSVIHVNSYHHQGVAQLAHRFCPMAFAPDGLIEAYYDPDCYDIANGQFIVGIQFHPERMQDTLAALEGAPPRFDYQGCSRPYRDFVAAATAFQQLEHDHSLPSSVQNIITNNNHVGKRQFSREEWSRLLKFGATVHGACLVQSLLRSQTADDIYPHAVLMRKKRSNIIRKLLGKLHQAERSIYGLRSDKTLQEANSLLERLSSLLDSEHTPPASPHLQYRFPISHVVS